MYNARSIYAFFSPYSSFLAAAQVIVLDVARPLTSGYQAVLHYGNINEPVVVTKLVEFVGKDSGGGDDDEAGADEAGKGKKKKKKKKKEKERRGRQPRRLASGDAAIIEVQSVNHPMAIETFLMCRQLGRFMIRDRGQTVACGIILKLLKKDESITVSTNLGTTGGEGSTSTT